MIRIDILGTGDPAPMSKFKVLTAGLAVVVLWASAFPAIRGAAPDLGVIGLSVARLAVASLSLLAVAPLPLLPWGWQDMVAASASAWGSALYLGLLPSALGFVLWGYAVANCRWRLRPRCCTSCRRLPS
jgi:drug/metabolite transporter (DMT)-like permease